MVTDAIKEKESQGFNMQLLCMCVEQQSHSYI